jgi:hypothetical protein
MTKWELNLIQEAWKAEYIIWTKININLVFNKFDQVVVRMDITDKYHDWCKIN